MLTLLYDLSFFFQFILPAIVHINHQPALERGDGPIVSSLSAYYRIEQKLNFKVEIDCNSVILLLMLLAVTLGL